MTTINWLHISDLHAGVDKNQVWLNMEPKWFDDIELLTNKDGSLKPIDLIFITGDITQSGEDNQFIKAESIFNKLSLKLESINNGVKPQLVFIPGNHDLVYPKSSTALMGLKNYWQSNNNDYRDLFWETPDCPERSLINEAFEKYTKWIEKNSNNLQNYHKGLLPGEFSATFEKEGIKLGILGLNTAFLQLYKGVGENFFEKKLAINAEQFHKACKNDDGVAWVNEHHLCILLSHHPPSWLNDDALSEFKTEIHDPPERFALHLFGHMHKHQSEESKIGESGFRRQLQACSLFSLEKWGENKKRRLGYAVGQIKIENGKAEYKLWPRVAVEKVGGGYKFDSDQSCLDTGKESTAPIKLTLLNTTKEPQNKTRKKNRGPIKRKANQTWIDSQQRIKELISKTKDTTSKLDEDIVLYSSILEEQNVCSDILLTGNKLSVLMESANKNKKMPKSNTFSKITNELKQATTKSKLLEKEYDHGETLYSNSLNQYIDDIKKVKDILTKIFELRRDITMVTKDKSCNLQSIDDLESFAAQIAATACVMEVKLKKTKIELSTQIKTNMNAIRITLDELEKNFGVQYE